MFRATALAALALFAVTTRADADEAPPSERARAIEEADEVVVTARAPRASSHVTPSVTVYDRDDIERRQATHVADLLDEAPGVYVVRDGPLGSFSRVFTRGALSTQTLVLIDGVPQNDATTGGGFDFGDLTTAGVERVEVLRGSYSVLYGSEAIGGVVNVVTRRGRGPTRGRVRLEGGSFSTQVQEVGIEGSDGDTDFAFTFDNVRSHGERDEEDFDKLGLLGRVGVAVRRDLRLDFSARYADSNTESPFDFATSGVLPRDGNIRRSRRTISTALAAVYDATEWLQVRLTGSLLDVDNTFRNGPDGRTRIDPDFTPGSGDEFGVVQKELNAPSTERDWRARLAAEADVGQALHWDAPDRGGLGLVFTLGGEHLDQASRGESTFPDFNAPTFTKTVNDEDTHTESLFAQAELSLPAAGPLEQGALTLGARRDRHSEFGSETSPYVGARVGLADTGVTLRASRGEGFRAPKPSELFDPFVGNTGLGAETSVSTDVGASARLLDEALELGVTWFRLDVDGLIAYDASDTTPDRPFGRLTNRNDARTTGFEYAARADLGRGFSARGGLTVQNPRDRSTGGALSNRARRFGALGVSFRDRDWLVSLDAFVSGHLPGTGGLVTYPEPRARRHPGRRTLINLTARYRVTDGFTVFGRVENLLDDAYAATPTAPAGLPLGVFFGVELDF